MREVPSKLRQEGWEESAGAAWGKPVWAEGTTQAQTLQARAAAAGGRTMGSLWVQARGRSAAHASPGALSTEHRAAIHTTRSTGGTFTF